MCKSVFAEEVSVTWSVKLFAGLIEVLEVLYNV